jgi:peptidoglycan/xylan/chitin deacetylase (PgdA/CDA1 family)
VEEVEAVEFPVEGANRVGVREAGERALGHPDRGGAVELDDGGGGEGGEHAVEGCDLTPVGVRGGRRAGAQAGDRGLDLVVAIMSGIDMVSLTFDNGPDPVATPRVLDVLAARAIKATFFVVGEKLARHRHLAERARAEGHWIGNHTYTHAAPFGVQDAGTARAEIERTQELLDGLAHPDRLFRPMGGGGRLDRRLFSRPALDALTAGGYSVVLWDRLPRDWEDPDGWVERALSLQGSVLVLHDVATGAMDRLEDFLDRAEQAGIEFTQDLSACMPIRRGEIVRPLDGLVTT